MEATVLIKNLLHLSAPWEVERVETDVPREEVHVYVVYHAREWKDPETGAIHPIVDWRESRTWQHLDIMEYRTILHCRIPRIRATDGSIRSCPVPWGEEGERHSYKFEDRMIDVLVATHNQTKAGVLMGVSYEKTTRIMHRSVERGLERRELEKEPVVSIHLDEKAYQKGQNYVSVLSDSVRKRVFNVVKGRKSTDCEHLLTETFTAEQLERIRAVCMDMWDPYMAAVKKNVRRLSLCMTSFMWSCT